MEKLLIIDGSNLLFQMFFGMPARIVNEQGKAIQAVVRESVISSAERLKVNYRLIKLKGSVTLPFPMQELEYRDNGVTTSEVLKGIGLR